MSAPQDPVVDPEDIADQLTEQEDPQMHPEAAEEDAPEILLGENDA